MIDYLLVAAVGLLFLGFEGLRAYHAQRRYLARVAETCGLKVGRWESAGSIRRRLDAWLSEPVHPWRDDK